MPNLLNVNKEDLGTKYPFIGYGDEGRVYNYNNTYAIKIFTKLRNPEYKSKYQRKLQKLEEMFELNDPNYAFPMGFVSIEGQNIDGYYTTLVKHKQSLKDFEDLELLHNKKKILEYLIKADKALQRIHSQGIIIGDIKEDNILIDQENNPIYIDTDNYKYKQYSFDLIPDRAGTFYSMYGSTSLSYRDNDILVFSIMALYLLTRLENFSFMNSPMIIDKTLAKLNFDRETQREIDYIFSKKTDKPYIGPVLKKINPYNLVK